MGLKKHKWNTRAVPFTEDELPKDAPKMLFAGIFSPMYAAHFMTKGFESAGWNCMPMNWQQIRFSETDKGVNDRLLAKTTMERPEVAFLHIQTPDVLYEETLQKMSEKTFVVLYTFDVRKDIGWMKKLAPHVGLLLFADMVSVNECMTEGILNVGYLPPAADYLTYRRLDIKEVSNEYGEVVFIGNNYALTKMDFELSEQRLEMISFMQKNFGDRFRVHGLNWPGVGNKVVYPHEEVLIYNSAKVAITHNHFHRWGYQSDRGLRSMGCGCHTIHHYYDGINVDYNSAVASTWLDFKMLGEMTEKALTNEPWRKAVADAGHDHVRKYHTWEQRATLLKNLIEKEKQRKENERLANGN